MDVSKRPQLLDGIDVIIVGHIKAKKTQATVAELLSVVTSYQFWPDICRQEIDKRIRRLVDRGFATRKKLSSRRLAYASTELGRRARRNTLDFYRSA